MGLAVMRGIGVMLKAQVDACAIQRRSGCDAPGGAVLLYPAWLCGNNHAHSAAGIARRAP
jgi:hypothetical protein